MGRQSLVVLSNLLAQIFLLYFQQRFRVLTLKPRDEEAEETTDQIGKPLEHCDSRPLYSNG
jgi:hypothetical protein